MKETDILNKLNNLLENSDKKWIKRNRKINTKNMFNLMSQILVKNKGIKHTIALNKIILEC